MLDTHAVTAVAGSTGALGGTFIIAAGGDGQTVAGVPIDPSATLIQWGVMTTIADTIERARLLSQDMVDPMNGEDWFPGANSVHGYGVFNTNIPYKLGLRQFAIDQNTAANPAFGFTTDAMSGGGQCVAKNYFPANKIITSQLFGGALTAITWGRQAFAPATPIPLGKYAIHGAWTSELTNYGLIRFQHSDFKGYAPGFPSIDASKAVARAVSVTDPIMAYQGHQFDYLSEITGKPCVPVFTVSNAGTGLNIEMLSITADTPRVTLLLSKVG